MEFQVPLLEGRLLRRYKRFLADIELDSGEVVVAHCPNPGAMLNCAPDRARAWVSRRDDPRRTLRYTWELVAVDDTLVCVNTAVYNPVVEAALRDGSVPELRGYAEVRREVRVGKHSRVDFQLRGPRRGKCLVEVKGVTLGLGGGLSAFPDSVTARGTRHLHELMDAAVAGTRAVLLFCCGRADTTRVRPADEIDWVYANTLRDAAAAGVEVLAYRCDITPARIELGERIPVDL